jgi:hypothetical protein
MPPLTLSSNFRCGLLVTSLKAIARAILISMGLDRVLIDFLASAAVGAATVLLVIVFVGIRIPRRAAVAVRRTIR